MAKNYRLYTEEEDQFLRDYPDEKVSELAKMLDRSVLSVKSRRVRLGIKRTSVPEGMRKCTKCEKILPLENFTVGQYRCKECSRKKNKLAKLNKLSKQKEDLIQEIKDKEYTCPLCKNVKKGSEFSIVKIKNNNKQEKYYYKRFTYCKECQRKKAQEAELKAIKNNNI